MNKTNYLNINNRIFQGDSLSYLFYLSHIYLSNELKTSTFNIKLRLKKYDFDGLLSTVKNLVLTNVMQFGLGKYTKFTFRKGSLVKFKKHHSCYINMKII